MQTFRNFLENNQVFDFLEKNKNSPRSKCQHFEYNNIQCYLCIQPKVMNGEVTRVLSLDSLQSDSPGGGKLNHFMEFFENLAKQQNLVVYINSVINNRLLGYFLRRGYKIYPNSEPPAVFRKFL